MTIINADISDDVVKRFRHVIYLRTGLKKGDFKIALEHAMIEYIEKHGRNYQ